MPRSICSALTSRRMTLTPRELSHWAMPDPMTPAPTTAACTILSMGAGEVPFLYFSARKKFRIRFCVASVSPSFTIASTSRASDASIVPRRPSVMTLRARAGAAFPVERCAAISPAAGGAVTCLFPSPSLAAAASSNCACGTTASTKPSRPASPAECSFPFKITSAAFSAPIKRGSLVAPPHAGIRPRVVSGKPMRVAGSSEATR